MKNEIDVRNFARKAESWDRWYNLLIPLASRSVQKIAASLPVFKAEPTPCDDFRGERPQYHVAKTLDGRRFVVDTQGYNYARYIERLPSRSRRRSTSKRRR